MYETNTRQLWLKQVIENEYKCYPYMHNVGALKHSLLLNYLPCNLKAFKNKDRFSVTLRVTFRNFSQSELENISFIRKHKETSQKQTNIQQTASEISMGNALLN